MLVLESPIRYAAWAKSGDMPSCINMGMKIGANKAHFADADPTNRLMNPVKMMIPAMVTPPGSAIAFKNSAPLTANKMPKLDWPKA